MTREVLVVSHADADGHVIAEQVRRNLEAVKGFRVTTVVDPARTKDHKAWLHLDDIHEIEKSDFVLFIDLMFAPASFGAEADALVRFADAHPSKRFFVMDHHPLPMRRLSAARNVRAVYRQDVLDCTVGTRSWMMIIAALCEKQPTRARDVKRPAYDIVVQGIRRAAALGGPLPGEKLLALLHSDRWRDLQRLGSEPAEEHRLPRGLRPRAAPLSKTLRELDKTATKLLSDPASSRHHPAGNAMSYDFETATNQKPPQVTSAVAQPNDLEAIVTLLELAAIYLTTAPEKEFTIEELIEQAQELGGSDTPIDPKDAKIVLDKATFLKKQGKRLSLR